MVHGRRPVRGGKRKFDRHNERKPFKAKKGKFNYRESSYIKEREAKNEAIENQRQILEREKIVEEQCITDSSEEEELDGVQTLLSTFSGVTKPSKQAIESSSESDESEEEVEEQTDNEEDEDISDINIKEEESEEENMEDESGEEEESEEEGEELGKFSKDNEAEESSDHEQLKDIYDDENINIIFKEDDEEDAETALEDAGHLNDPFSKHLRNDMDNALYEAVSSVPQVSETKNIHWPTLGNVIFQIPKPTKNSISMKNKMFLLDKTEFAEYGSVPSIINKVDMNKLYIKTQIQNNVITANQHNMKDDNEKNPKILTPLQKELFSIMNNYQDLYFPQRTFNNADEIRFTYCLHAINHALKTRTKILHHNAKLGKSKGTSISDVPDEYRDQGLVRPKILIIVPFRHSCLKIVELLISILIGVDKGGSVMNKKRFLEDFSGNELIMSRRNPKPEDYEKTFQGNTDDSFKIGISITKKTLKLYSEFYSSDIIISSVLGLRMLIGAEGEADRDYDFLASIEMLIMDQTELYLMQNWDHLLHIMDHLHLQPKDAHGTDFSRLRSWCVNGWTKYYRQTLMFSSLQLPEINAVFNRKCFNYSGKAKISNVVTPGSICQIALQIPQIFHRFEVSNHCQTLDNRFEFFVNKVLPQYKETIMNHTVIFVPSYFDFVKIRNYLTKETLNFVQICEYSKDAKVARARDMFFHSDAHFLLYSERFHFFRRIRLKGIRHIIFYAPPTFPQFYSEMCNLMQEVNQNPKAGSVSDMTVTTIYSKYDALQLAAIVSTEKASKMITSDKTIHMLMTGD